MFETVAKLKTEIEKGMTADYQSVPFWSWNNELDERELVKQIEEMKAANIGGFIIHARLGLTTEYLGEKWFSCVGACLEKARELGMNAWIYDENGWPSGFVGGKLLENESFLAQFLEYEVKDSYDDTAYAVYEKTDSGYTLLGAEKEDVSEYHCVYIRTSPANTDILNPEVVDAFIAQTHEKYYERFKDSFGKELVGFFTDEPQYYRWSTPYTRVAHKAYEEKYGYNDIRENLIYIFNQDEAGYPFRYRWYTLLNELYVLNFYKKLYDWCEDHGCKLTGHSVEENGLACQMNGGAGVMPSYEYEHIPAIDALGSRCMEFSPRQISSVASQLDFKHILSETFGCAGTNVTPRELKGIAESQFFNGVNLMCQHLLPYSFAGQAKHDHPPTFSKHGNWWEQFGAFNEYFNRLAYIVANTKENYDILIIHPLRSVYLNYIRSQHAASVADLEKPFMELLAFLRKHGVQYHLADERLLARYGKAEGDKLRVGNCVYDTVLIPDMPTIARESLEILGEYSGKLCVIGMPEFVDGERAEVNFASNTTLDDIVAAARIKFRCEGGAGITSRKGELGDFIFIMNYHFDEPATVTTEGISQSYRILDLEELGLKPFSDEYTLAPHEGIILIKDDTPMHVEKREEQDITADFAVTGISENYLVLDYGSLSYDGVEFSKAMPLPQLFEKLLREDYKGQIYIRQSFTVKDLMPLTLMMEKGRFAYIKLNGKTLTSQVSDFDFNFVECDLTDELIAGENTVEYSVDYYQHEGVHFALFDPMATESLRNCLYYDTHIENAYIKGDFVLDDSLAITKRVGFPPLTREMRGEGYPFFMGVLTIDGEYDYDGTGSREIHLDGKYLAAEVYVDGKRTDLALTDRKDITPYLKKGRNGIRILVRSSVRNLFGALHFDSADEPRSNSPKMFTMRGSWGDGIARSYTHEYKLVEFGADKISIIKVTD